MSQDLCLSGKRLGRYDILRELGRGGMAVVYEAKNDAGERFAVKVLPASLLTDQSVIDRFDREAKSQASLRHPNIIRVYETAVDRDLHYFVMELIEGATLERRLDQENKLPVTEALRIARKIAEAVAYAHDHQVIHRDIKPANILLSAPDRVTVMDFGLVKLVEAPRLTQTGAVMGTPLYMSPEQARGEEVDTRTDIYSLGMVLYEMVTGVNPFEADSNLRVIRNVIEKTPRRPKVLEPDLSAEVEAIILKAIARNKEERYHSARQILDDLDKFEKGISLKRPAAPQSKGSPVTKQEFPKLIREFLTQQDVAMKVLRMFPKGHPQAVAAVSQYFGILEKLFSSQETVTLSESSGHLVVEGVLMEATEKRASDFAKNLVDWKLSSLTFCRGITLETIEKFLRLLATEKDALQEEGALARMLSEGAISHIRLDEVHYEKVSKGSSSSSSGSTVSEFILSDYLQRRFPGVFRIDDLLKKFSENFRDFKEEDWKDLRSHLAEVILAMDPTLRSQVLRDGLLSGKGGRIFLKRRSPFSPTKKS